MAHRQHQTHREADFVGCRGLLKELPKLPGQNPSAAFWGRSLRSWEAPAALIGLRRDGSQSLQ